MVRICDAFLQHIRKLMGALPADSLTDGQLLERFVAERDETAFAALVDRHGALVLSVCRRLLADSHEVEDVFQATFLVLVRRARSIVRRDSVGSWLYGVAYRLALRARTLSSHRPNQTTQVSDMPAPEISPSTDWDVVLDEEVQRLPEKYRQPVVLCYFEGLAYAEAALQLGWPAGTVAVRLARARQLLRGRLERRGVAPTSLPPAALLANASVSPELRLGTLRAAGEYAVGRTAVGGCVSALAAALADGFVQSLFLARLRLLAVAFLALLALGTGVTVWGLQPDAVEPASVADADDKPVAAAQGPNPEALDPELVPLPEPVDAEAPPDLMEPDVLPPLRAEQTTPITIAARGTLPSTGQLGEVVRVQLLADGKTLAVGRSGGLMLYQGVAQTHVGEALEAAKDSIRVVAFSADGQRAVVGHGKQQGSLLKLWDVAARRELGQLRGAPENIATLTFSPDGKTVACGGWSAQRLDKKLRPAVQLWDVATCRPRSKLEGLGIGALAFSADGKLLAAGAGRPGGVQVCDLTTGTLSAMGGRTDGWSVRALAFAADGQKLMAADGYVLKTWDLASKKAETYVRCTPELGDRHICAATFSADASWVAFGADDGKVRIWDTATRQFHATVDVTAAFVTALAFSPDGRTLLTGAGHDFPVCPTGLRFDGYPVKVWHLNK